MASQALLQFFFAFLVAASTVNCNMEGDILYAWKTKLIDTNNVLQSWDPTLVNPCTWFHVTCNINNSVTRLDLGSAGLEGPLIPELRYLTNLQFLEVYKNNFTGSIPPEIGNLTSLVSLDLYNNRFSGPIPASLGNLKFLRFLRLNNNNLTGKIPTGIIHLILDGNLKLLNVADNSLAGRVHSTNSSGFAVTRIIQDPRAQMWK